MIMQNKVTKTSITETLRNLNIGISVSFQVAGRNRECSYPTVKNTICRLRPFRYSSKLVDFGQSVIVTRLK